MSFLLLMPLLCYDIIVSRNEQSNHPRNERGKEDRYGPFFRTDYLFFARTKVLSAHNFLNFSCLSNHAYSFSCRSSCNLLHSPDFYKTASMRRETRNTMMALLFWLARFYIFGFFAATISLILAFQNLPPSTPKKYPF